MSRALSIYLHWPFCKSKCPYCDFNSHVREHVDAARWQRMMLRELDYYAELTQGRQVVSIFFGGGTPSLMPPGLVAALLARIHARWSMATDVEITLEANPSSVETEQFRAFRDAGVNRASLGIQALDDAALRFLARPHTVAEGLAAINTAKEIFPRFSFDLIYARPGQNLNEWEAELTRALGLAGEHLSLYQLTIEENTAFHHAYHRGEFALPDDDAANALYTLTQALMEAHGLPAYEISNHARPGAQSRHNLAYWRGDDYIGIGPGAHGRYREGKRIIAASNVKSPERWLEQMETHGLARAETSEVSHAAREEELLLMGLRLTDGIAYDDWHARTGHDLRARLPAATLTHLQEGGMITATPTHLCATRQGRLVLNSVIRALLLAT